MISENNVRLIDRSRDFGGVPKEVLQLFEIQLKEMFSFATITIKPEAYESDYKRFGL